MVIEEEDVEVHRYIQQSPGVCDEPPSFAAPNLVLPAKLSMDPTPFCEPLPPGDDVFVETNDAAIEDVESDGETNFAITPGRTRQESAIELLEDLRGDIV